MRCYRKAGLWTSVLVAIAVAVQASAPVHVEPAQEQRYLQDLKFLAAPEMEGRGAGTAGLQRASTYIADEFKKLALQPVGGNGSYTQAFSVVTGAEPGPANSLSQAGLPALKFQQDFVPVSFSSNGKVSGPVVFAGYGITAPEFGYDDYAGLDVKNKIVLVLRYEPKEFVKAKHEKTTVHAHLINKAINARNHGASAILLVNTASSDHKDDLIEFGKVAGPEDAGIPMMQVKRSVADKWLGSTSLSELQSKIDTGAKPASFAIAAPAKLSLQVDVTRKETTVQNVLGYLPGRSKEYLVIGAHYDHIGYGHENSMAPAESGKVHPGADDNASGTAGLLELARIFSQRRSELDRGILFAAFAGEELGLLGSARWVKNPTMPLENAVAMINMDMIGRSNGSKLFVGGIGSGTTFEAVVKDAAGKHEFTVDQSFQGYSASDHASFLAKKIPALFFFSGLHKDYHKPSDTWDKVNAAGAAKVVSLVADVAAGLVNADTRAQFVKVKPSAPHAGASSGESSSGNRGGYGPYFGVMPDFAPLEKGVLFADVSEGSPAAEAGLQIGDILVAFGDKPIQNIYDFTYTLRGSKVGDVVRVKVLRDGKEQSFEVKLAARR